MRIVEDYSHLNGLEYLLVHKPELWDEIQRVIASVDASQYKTKISREKTMRGKAHYTPLKKWSIALPSLVGVSLEHLTG